MSNVVKCVISLLLFIVVVECSNNYNRAEQALNKGEIAYAEVILTEGGRKKNLNAKSKALLCRIHFAKDSCKHIQDSINTRHDSLILFHAKCQIENKNYEYALSELSKTYNSKSKFQCEIDSLKEILSAKISEREKRIKVLETERKHNAKDTKKINFCKEIKNYQTDLKKLFSELNSFKNTQDFKKYGFGGGGKYRTWLENVKKYGDELLLLSQKDHDGYFTMYMAFSRLEQIGREYLSDHSKESTIKYMKDDIHAGLTFDCSGR